MIGVVAVLGGFMVLAYAGVQVAMATPDRFHSLLAGGIVGWFVVQTMINVGGVTGLMPVTGLTLSGSFAYNDVKIPDTINPFKQTINGQVIPITTPQRIYQVYTPKYSASAAIDYELPLGLGTLRAHLDGNYDSGFYGNYTDPLIDRITHEVRVAQPKGDKGFVVNGRLSLADISVGTNGEKLAVSIWSRNLLNEQHVFLKSTSATGGTTGFFNDPRTWGVDLNVKL